MAQSLLSQTGGTHQTADERFAETVDIVPTILDGLGVAPEQWRTDGTSLRAARPPDRPTTAVYRRPTRKRSHAVVHRADRQDLAEAKLEPARRLRREFGRLVEDLHRLVPMPALRAHLDQPRSALPNIDSQRMVKLSESGARIRVGQNAPKLPVYVAGTVNADDTDRRVPVAIVVDGVVRAFTRTVRRPSGKPKPFQLMLLPSCMTPGEHEIEAVAQRPPRQSSAEGQGAN